MDAMVAFSIAAAGLIALAIGASYALRRLLVLEELPDLDRLNDSPQEKYAAMGRLFSAGDLEFLISQPGYSPQLEAGFRRKRAEVFGLYLRSMQKDFAAIHTAARMMAAQGVGGAELSGHLVRLPLVFKRTVLMARWHGFLYVQGWAVPEVSIAPAVDAMFRLRAQINLSAMASTPTA